MRSLFFIVFLGMHVSAFSQTVDVKFSADEISLGEELNLTIEIQELADRPNLEFPNLEGFAKKDKNAKTITIEGTKKTKHIINQIYEAQKAGKYKIPQFQFVINKKSFGMPQGFLNIKDPKALPKTKPETPKGFLEISKLKESYYQGEAVPYLVKLFIPDSQAPLYEFSKSMGDDLAQIQTKLKPANTIEQKLISGDFKPSSIIKNGVQYQVYTLIANNYFANSAGIIKFPGFSISVNFVSLNTPTSRKTQIQNLEVAAKTIKIKDLPEHPLKNMIFVGNLSYSDQVEKLKMQTGSSQNIKIQLRGTGNMEFLKFPTQIANADLDMYPYKTEQKPAEKTIFVKIIPKKQGQYTLKNQLFFPYFNVEVSKYDTLKSEAIIEVEGPTITTQTVPQKSEEKSTTIFDHLASQTSTLDYFDINKQTKKAINVLIPILLIISVLSLIVKIK